MSLSKPEEATEATAAILLTSCCMDGCRSDEVIREIAKDIISTIEATETGKSVQAAVEANWELDDFSREELFGTGETP